MSDQALTPVQSVVVFLRAERGWFGREACARELSILSRNSHVWPRLCFEEWLIAIDDAIEDKQIEIRYDTEEIRTPIVESIQPKPQTKQLSFFED